MGIFHPRDIWSMSFTCPHSFKKWFHWYRVWHLSKATACLWNFTNMGLWTMHCIFNNLATILWFVIGFWFCNLLPNLWLWMKYGMHNLAHRVMMSELRSDAIIILLFISQHIEYFFWLMRLFWSCFLWSRSGRIWPFLRSITLCYLRSS